MSYPPLTLLYSVAPSAMAGTTLRVTRLSLGEITTSMAADPRPITCHVSTSSRPHSANRVKQSVSQLPAPNTPQASDQCLPFLCLHTHSPLLHPHPGPSSLMLPPLPLQNSDGCWLMDVPRRVAAGPHSPPDALPPHARRSRAGSPARPSGCGRRTPGPATPTFERETSRCRDRRTAQIDRHFKSSDAQTFGRI